MALHRDIYWVGRQWAVTGSGIQACDQKQKGKFDIEAARLWEDGVLESTRALTWLNSEDFEKALSVARKYYPEPPRKEPPVPPPAPPELIVSGLASSVPKNTVAKNDIPKNGISRDDIAGELIKPPPKPVVGAFDLRIEGSRAKFLPVWRIRVHGR
ncbi:hypothetical protein [Bradyrhizobium sp. dw_411]|uniref:hypothetical protein n=1 Tax=Bradyrhizobium sp. dw_411 TaxID=2720082 RepID=UPI001BCEB404|nr:hypothetical protein [Bradyrhizobium sp. dw_411]